jgi:hypothetical protein
MLRRIAGALLVVVPTVATAFEAVDTLPYPSRSSAFPAYAPDVARRQGSYWAQAGLMYDSNIFRLPTGLDPRAFLRGSRGDTVMRLGAGASYDQRIFGRQNLFLSARGEYYDFVEYNAMDHFAYGLTGEWRSEWGNDLTTAVGVDRTRRLVDAAEIRRPVATYVVSDRLLGRAAYSLLADWRVRVSAEATRGQRESEGRADDDPRGALELEGSGVTVGTDYVTPLGNAIGVEVRRSTGEATVPAFVDPTFAFDAAEFVEREVAGTLTYVAGVTLRLTGRLGRTNREYSNFGGRDFNGTTYRTGLEYRPGNKTVLALDLYRTPQSIIDVAASHVLVTGTSFGVSWAPTIKLVFSGRMIHERRQYSDPASVVAEGARDETARVFRLGAGWEPRRFVELSAGIEYGERSTNILFRDYDYWQWTINAAARF